LVLLKIQYFQYFMCRSLCTSAPPEHCIADSAPTRKALTQDRIWDILPCVLVTAKGQPDLATRAFCKKLTACLPQHQGARCECVVDDGPLLTHGSPRCAQGAWTGTDNIAIVLL
jgi:hypothetical protein